MAARMEYVTDEAAPAEVRSVFDAAQAGFGRVFNTYRVLAHRPEILAAWHQLLVSILGMGNVEPQLKMLAFTTGSQANACVY
ncbi:MAG: hypothetical protein ACREQ5_36760 [Candidatus Dormibacteria bacterium]